jgi:hypothetical protein
MIPGPGFTRYATDVIVVSTENEYILHFYELRPPVLLQPPGQVQPPVGQPPAEAELVARIVVSPARLPLFIEALNQSLEQRKDTAD